MAVTLAVAREMVDNYCPAAPDTIQAAAAEHVLRFLQIGPESMLADGGQQVQNPHPKTRNAIVHSVVGSMLAPWRRIRTAVVEVAP